MKLRENLEIETSTNVSEFSRQLGEILGKSSGYFGQRRKSLIGPCLQLGKGIVKVTTSVSSPA